MQDEVPVLSQALGGAAGTSLALATYAIQIFTGKWDWVVQSAAQDLAWQGFELALPWLATAILAASAGVLGVRAARTRNVQRRIQGFFAILAAVLPMISFLSAIATL